MLGGGAEPSRARVVEARLVNRSGLTALNALPLECIGGGFGFHLGERHRESHAYTERDTGTQAQRPAREDEDGRPERSRKRKSVDKKVCMPPVSCALSRDQCSDPIEDTASVDRRP